MVYFAFLPSAFTQTLHQDLTGCNDDFPSGLQVNTIEIINRPIFDENAANTISLHRWANAMHIITRPGIIQDRLTFKRGDVVTEEDILEAQAILRAQRFLADATISTTNNCEVGTMDVKIETYDNWSLIPTLSFSRRGSENSALVGIREDNLLGLGIRATARYTKDEQRSGYQLAFSSIVPWVEHANLFLRLENNDDGDIYSVAFEKPFYHLDSANSLLLSANQTALVEEIFQNNKSRNSFHLAGKAFTGAYGWRIASNNRRTSRLMLGLTYNKAIFSSPADSPANDVSFTPTSRDFLYPWVSFVYAERDILVMRDIYLINQPEDINLGWQLTARLGVEADNSEGGLGIHTQATITKSLITGLNQLLMASATFNAITNTGISDFIRVDSRLEYFYRHSDLIGYYLRLNGTLSAGQFLDQPIVIDDENGVRGFPNQYQHGDHRIAAGAEVRLYTNYNFYQLFEVGFAAFADVGKAFDGKSARLNEESGWLHSVGLGARLFSNKSSNSGVVHIDVAKPFGAAKNVNNWEWSIQLKKAF
ncbi:BamA/TamA family outer membrane protein [Salinimonas chungwhensis]|uniref:BamA/TamA family outer membrane protein n=1 Tax=Salinimonas chungwhensis TaxID=265425 RepID=UPI00036CEF4E|nr:BamA/TamA family outer membrane protein [Salinimonas chungwhensis]